MFVCWCKCGGEVVSYDGVYCVCKKCGRIGEVNWSKIG